MNLADTLRSWRRQKKLSIRKAAERIGVDRNALYRLERGEGVGHAVLASVMRWMLAD